MQLYSLHKGKLELVLVAMFECGETLAIKSGKAIITVSVIGDREH